VQYGQGGANNNYVDLEVTCRVQQQEVKYIPQFWQMMKLAWSKYLALVILFYVGLHYWMLNGLMTGSSYFDTLEISEIQNQF